MKKEYISLIPDPPAGFLHCSPSKRQLLGGALALLADSTETALSLLEGFEDRVRGVVFTCGEVAGHSPIGDGLWHFSVTEEMLPSLHDMASCYLDIMARGQSASDECWALRIEIERRRENQQEAQDGYNESVGRLGSMVADLRKEIVERKRAEEEKLALERQILHAQKLESLGIMAGGIAHDFNNLLMAILGNADLALDELSPLSPARGKIMEIENASKRAADLAKQMLAYSGKGRFLVESIDPGELLDEMAHLLKVSISKKAVLKFNLARDVPSFDGDATQVRQVIMNLITNASEAIGDRNGVIALSTGAMHCDRAYLDGFESSRPHGLDEPLPEGIYTYFEVADTGCGMDAATIERIFDPFFSTKFTGRGLGMSAVLGIVRGHGGTLRIYSELGKGTTFKVLFPANVARASEAEVNSSQRGDDQDWQGQGTVLIVDDEETIRGVASQMLERLGFSVVAAADGREALELLRDSMGDIACVLLDLTMPDMDGVETYRELRRLRPDLRVLLCSGYNEQDAMQNFAGKGLAGFLQKPFTLANLRAKMTELLPGPAPALDDEHRSQERESGSNYEA